MPDRDATNTGVEHPYHAAADTVRYAVSPRESLAIAPTNARKEAWAEEGDEAATHAAA